MMSGMSNQKIETKCLDCQAQITLDPYSSWRVIKALT